MGQLTTGEAAHAASILDLNATLKPIPSKRVVRILVGVPVRKPPVVIEQLIRTLKSQQCRDTAAVPAPVIDIVFVPNFGDEPYREEALEMLRSVEGAGVSAEFGVDAADYGDGPASRAWTKSAFERMGRIKNEILRVGLEKGYDYVWLLDADVMCDPYTLQSMLDTAGHDLWLYNEALLQPIVSAVYWTRWVLPQPDTTDMVHAGPQVWLRHPYKLEGRGYTEQQFRAALINRKRTRVWGLGACTLIPRSALEKGVNFSKFEGLPPGPMSEGEDRSFCARATQMHIQMVADPWPDVYHAYHPAEYDRMADEVERLSVPHKEKAEFGDLVSARVQLLEPIPDGTGRALRPQPRWIRGRLGALPVLPQIEEELAGMPVGSSRLVKLYIPAHWPTPHLRRKMVMAQVMLFDVKPYRVPPIIEEELLVGKGGGRVIDSTTMTDEQLMDMVDDRTES